MLAEREEGWNGLGREPIKIGGARKIEKSATVDIL